MTDKQKRFANLFKESGHVLTPELSKLFDEILMEDFNDNPELMTAFMDNLQGIPESPLDQQVAMLQETVLQLSGLLMGGM